MKIPWACFVATLLCIFSAGLGTAQEADWKTRAQDILGSASQVEPLELTLVKDLVDQRADLVRLKEDFYKTGTLGIQTYVGSAKVRDAPLGLYFGNGLFLDSNGNLGILADRLAGIGPDFKGETRFRHFQDLAFGAGTDTRPIFDRVTYEPPALTVDRPYLPYGPQKINLTDKKISSLLMTVTDVDDGTVKIDPDIPLILNGSTWTKLPNGYKRDFLASFVGGLPFPANEQTVLDQGTIKGSFRGIKYQLDNDGTQLHMTYADKEFWVFRAQNTVVVFEPKEAPLVFHLFPDGVQWTRQAEGVLGPTETQVDYSLTVINREGTPVPVPRSPVEGVFSGATLTNENGVLKTLGVPPNFTVSVRSDGAAPQSLGEPGLPVPAGTWDLVISNKSDQTWVSKVTNLAEGTIKLMDQPFVAVVPKHHFQDPGNAEEWTDMVPVLGAAAGLDLAEPGTALTAGSMAADGGDLVFKADLNGKPLQDEDGFYVLALDDRVHNVAATVELGWTQKHGFRLRYALPAGKAPACHGSFKILESGLVFQIPLTDLQQLEQSAGIGLGQPVPLSFRVTWRDTPKTLFRISSGEQTIQVEQPST